MLLMPAPCQFSGFGLGFGGEAGDEETGTVVGLRGRGRGENSTRRHVL
jgi:hypothetical protein